MPNDRHPKPTYLYIAGTNYCGSTLLAFMLGTHPGVESLGQFFQFLPFWNRNRRCTCGAETKQCALWSRVMSRMQTFAPEQDRLVGVDLEVQKGSWLHRLSRCAARHEPANLRAYRDFNIQLVESLQEVTKRHVFVDSSKLAHRLDLLLRSGAAQAWNFRILYLLRDGRAVVASHKRRGLSVLRASIAWRYRLRMIRQVLARHRPEHVMRLPYELLCTDPETALKRLCEFAGIAYEPTMLRFRDRIQHQIGGNPMRFNSDDRIRLDERWRQELRWPARAVFRLVAGAEQRRLGYPS